MCLKVTRDLIFTITAAKADQVRCLKICGCMCIAVLVATLAVIVGVCYGLPGEIYHAAHSGQTMRVLTSSQLICFLLYKSSNEYTVQALMVLYTRVVCTYSAS